MALGSLGAAGVDGIRRRRADDPRKKTASIRGCGDTELGLQVVEAAVAEVHNMTAERGGGCGRDGDREWR